MKFTNIVLKTYNAVAINDGTNYVGRIPRGTPIEAASTVIESPRNEDSPVYGGKSLNSRVLPIIIGIMSGGNFETMQNLFDTRAVDLARLVVTDSATSEDYYVNATPISFNAEGGGKKITVVLHISDPVWRKVTADAQTKQCTTDPTTSDTFANGGSYFCRPIITLTPKSARTGGYTYARFVTIYNQTDLAGKNYPVNVLDTVVDHATLVGAGKAQADGDDWRVMVDGVQVDQFVGGGGYNSATLKSWGTLDFSPRIEATLGVAIADSGAVTTITLESSAASYAAIRKLKAVSNKMVLIDSEVFTFTGVTESAYQLTGVTRAQRFSALAAHTTADTVRWLEHDVMVLYGRATATAQVINANRAPMFALTSTNISWVYTDYYEAAYPSRPGSWEGTILSSTGLNKGGTTALYTANQGTNVTSGAADEMGMKIGVYSYFGAVRTEQASLQWQHTCPFGAITDVLTSGEKYRVAASWPTASLQKLLAGKWLTAWTEATPASAATWTAFGATATSLSGNYSAIRYLFEGSVLAAAANYAAFEVDTITLTKSATLIPKVILGAESSQYNINATITNGAQSIAVTGVMAIDDVLTIDCDAQTVKLNGAINCLSWITLNTDRREWLRLATGNNTVTYTEAGVVRVDMALTWEERSL
jgi:hypothetical protein